MIVPDGPASSRRNAWPLRSELPPLAPLPSVPKIARAHTGITCTGWQLGVLADNAEAVVSELVTNAVQASVGIDGNPVYVEGRMPVVSLRLFSDGITLLVEVRDEAPGKPVFREPGPDLESGRGLFLVAAMALQWGWDEVPGGKCVWAALGRKYQAHPPRDGM